MRTILAKLPQAARARLKPLSQQVFRSATYEQGLARGRALIARWWASIADDELFLSVLVLGEIRKGIELARPRDPLKAVALEQWLDTVTLAFAGRILLIDQVVADEWGRLNAPHARPTIDSLLAATAKVHNLTLVTRNVADVQNTGARILNPFS